MDVLVRIGRDRFVVDSTGVTALRRAIESAVRSGGALVRIGAGDDAPEALVTPASSVRIDHAHRPLPADSEHLDYDAYL
ncbi:MAG: hypothetical protein Q7T71_09425 [Herbiconiux sp.]|nr:hypothetical protein [Herbiconiux sp.]